ncbi:MAG: ribosome silencing factor [Gammaproteobacteria bacterium]|nr:ribosome silencing factor [Gammaproteobacteria bacterium]
MMTNNLPDLVIAALEDAKGTDIHVLDVRNLTSMTDFMILVSGSSDRQLRALAEHVIERAKHAGYPPLGMEGEHEGEWVLVDLGDVIVHIMLPRVREFYQLERLWSAPPAATMDDREAAVAQHYR